MLGTLLLGWAGAWLCVQGHTPLPWMLGPLVVTAVASMGGAPTASHHRLRNAGQWVIATTLGLYFTPQLGAVVVGLWWAMLLGVAWALVLGWGMARWLQWLHGPHLPALSPAQLRATTYFAGAIGGASEMTQLAEREGARTDLVAAAHSLRVLLVTLTVPFAVLWWGGGGAEAGWPMVREVRWLGLLALAGWTALGAVLLQRLGRANPWFMGPLLVSMALSLAGAEFSAVPPGWSNAAQLLLGISLGVRFRPSFWRTAPRWLGSIAVGTAAMVVLCAGFAELLARWTALLPATLVLGTAPGGIAEMAVTAKVLHLGVPLVTAWQACRLVAVLVLAEPLYRCWWRLPAAANHR